MTTNTVSTRRRFFWKAGAVLSAPLAAVAADAEGKSAGNDDALKAHLAMLEDIEAIRLLHRTYAGLVNAGAHRDAARLFAAPARADIDTRIRSLTADRFGEHDVTEIAADRETAMTRIHCIVVTETPLEPRCTLVEMARAQGDGVARRSERVVLESSYVKRHGAWKIDGISLRST